MATEYFGISNLASFYGVSFRTLRFYEQIGLMHPKRTGTARLYTVKDRQRLEIILKGRRLGFSLSEIIKIISSVKQYPREEESDEKFDLLSILSKEEIIERIRLLELRKIDIEEALLSLGEGLGKAAPQIDKTCTERGLEERGGENNPSPLLKIE